MSDRNQFILQRLRTYLEMYILKVLRVICRIVGKSRYTRHTYGGQGANFLLPLRILVMEFRSLGLHS